MTANLAPAAAAFPRKPLPKRFCNLDRLLQALKARGLDGIVATLPNNVFYLTGFNGIAHKSDEPRVCAVILSRHVPDHPIIVVADYYLDAYPHGALSENEIRAWANYVPLSAIYTFGLSDERPAHKENTAPLNTLGSDLPLADSSNLAPIDLKKCPATVISPLRRKPAD